MCYLLAQVAMAMAMVMVIIVWDTMVLFLLIASVSAWAMADIGSGRGRETAEFRIGNLVSPPRRRRGLAYISALHNTEGARGLGLSGYKL